MLPSPNNSRLKPLNASDAPWLAALHTQCFEAERCWSEALFHSSLQNPTTFGFVAISGDAPVGFILCSFVADEAEMLTLCVTPDKQRSGIAHYLIQESLHTLREKKIKKIFLEVAVDNIPAIELYKKMNFEKSGLRKNYYARANGVVDALLMACAID